MIWSWNCDLLGPLAITHRFTKNTCGIVNVHQRPQLADGSCSLKFFDGWHALVHHPDCKIPGWPFKARSRFKPRLYSSNVSTLSSKLYCQPRGHYLYLMITHNPHCMCLISGEPQSHGRNICDGHISTKDIFMVSTCLWTHEPPDYQINNKIYNHGHYTSLDCYSLQVLLLILPTQHCT